MTQLINNFTTIRITKTLKSKIENLTSKNETYSDALEKVIDSTLATKAIEKDIIQSLKKKKYVDFDDIEW